MKLKGPAVASKLYRSNSEPPSHNNLSVTPIYAMARLHIPMLSIDDDSTRASMLWWQICNLLYMRCGTFSKLSPVKRFEVAFFSGNLEFVRASSANNYFQLSVCRLLSKVDLENRIDKSHRTI